MYEGDDYLKPDSHYGTTENDYRYGVEYERQYAQKSPVPDAVQNFIRSLQKAINSGNINETQTLYENNYPKLTERFYSTSPWPHLDEIADILSPQNDKIFPILYQELYFRHLYAKHSSSLTISQRFDSYFNYCHLFNMIVSGDDPIDLELPNQWLWEIMDEFIYQFQAFSHFRSSIRSRNEEDLRQFQEFPKVWNIHSVLNVLHSLVERSNINQQLEVYTNGGDPDTVAGEFGRLPLYKMLGYFSLVGLLRLNSLLGDYYQAIKVLENIELNKKSLYSRVPACQISSYYYVGFAYMMMRRYADAIRIFSSVLLYIQRTRHLFFYKTYQVAQVDKQTEQMYHLLAICLSLYPQRIDESVMLQLKDKCGDKMYRMQEGKIEEFESCFNFACPKFLSPVINMPNFPEVSPETQDLKYKEPYNQQLQVFKEEVQHQLKLPTVRTYLKLYTTMPFKKLVDFMDKVVEEPKKEVEVQDDQSKQDAAKDSKQTISHVLQVKPLVKTQEQKEEELMALLLCFKHKMKNMVWTKGGSGLDGEFQSVSEVDFYIDKEMIHIADTKVARRYGDYFIRQIHKTEELNRVIAALPY